MKRWQGTEAVPSGPSGCLHPFAMPAAAAKAAVAAPLSNVEAGSDDELAVKGL